MRYEWIRGATWRLAAPATATAEARYGAHSARSVLPGFVRLDEGLTRENKDLFALVKTRDNFGVIHIRDARSNVHGDRLAVANHKDDIVATELLIDG